MDVDLLPVGDGYNLPEPETLLLSEGLATPVRRTSSAIIIEKSPSLEVAPLRRKVRVAKIIPLDTRMELSNNDLIRWNTNYLSNMADKNRESYAKKALIQAKKNAHEWTLGGGIAAVAARAKTSKVTTHLDIFAGATLYEMITGFQLSPTGKKRSRESEAEDAVDSERRGRPRFEDEDQIGRGADVELVDEGLQMHSDVEMPREAVEGMEDISSVMPWNITASIRGSSVVRPPPGSRAGSQGRFRIISASPLTGRSRPSGLDPIMVEEEEGDTSDSGVGEDVALGGISENEFEKSGPAAHVDKQTTTRHSWQQDVIDQESINFREFVEHAIEEKRRAQGLGSPKEGLNMIDFDELLPPKSNSRVVAAQAFLHVLSLASKNMIMAVQKEAYGSIDLRFISTNA
jgi:meiotic recombination protein REC8